MIEIATLIPTHNRLRSPQNLEFFANNQIGKVVLPHIDGKTYVHDGHHRLVSKYLRGIKTLDNKEFVVYHFTREDYLDLVPEKGWVTPFDVVNECRLPDFFNFKRTVMEMYEFGLDISEIVGRRENYLEPRTIHSIAELAEIYRHENWVTEGYFK